MTAHYTEVAPEIALCLALQSQISFESYSEVDDASLTLSKHLSTEKCKMTTKIITITSIIIASIHLAELLPGVACLTPAGFIKVFLLHWCFFLTWARLNRCYNRRNKCVCSVCKTKDISLIKNKKTATFPFFLLF